MRNPMHAPKRSARHLFLLGAMLCRSSHLSLSGRRWLRGERCDSRNPRPTLDASIAWIDSFGVLA